MVHKEVANGPQTWHWATKSRQLSSFGIVKNNSDQPMVVWAPLVSDHVCGVICYSMFSCHMGGIGFCAKAMAQVKDSTLLG